MYVYSELDSEARSQAMPIFILMIYRTGVQLRTTWEPRFKLGICEIISQAPFSSDHYKAEVPLLFFRLWICVSLQHYIFTHIASKPFYFYQNHLGYGDYPFEEEWA